MPYQWLPPEGDTQRLHLWPHRSLDQRGFVAFIGVTAVLSAAPLVSVLGNPAVWALLPFLLASLGAIWLALRKNGRDRDQIEELILAPGHVRLTRHDPRRPSRSWEANPHWVRVTMHDNGGPVPHYITLAGGPREVELGAFLSADERMELAGELTGRLAALRDVASAP